MPHVPYAWSLDFSKPDLEKQAKAPLFPQPGTRRGVLKWSAQVLIEDNKKWEMVGNLEYQVTPVTHYRSRDCTSYVLCYLVHFPLLQTPCNEGA